MQTTKQPEPEFIRDMGLGDMYAMTVKEHQLIEKGVLTQADLEHVLDQPIWEPSDRRAKETMFKILRIDNPDIRISDIE